MVEAGAAAAVRLAKAAREAPGRRKVEERLVLGWTDREIAADLGTKLQTVRNRVGRVRKFWGARTRVGLVEVLRGRVGEVRGRTG